MSELEAQFKEVGDRGKGMSYRGAPFWSWNDDLDEQELRHQVREMKKAGWGGYFMHSRVGLSTAYMGEAWMKCIKACVDEGKKLGMKSWLYDEDGWPSGYGGGLVSGRGGEFVQQYLKYREQQLTSSMSQFVPRPGSLKYYLGEKKGTVIGNLEDVTGQPILVSAHRGKTVFEFYVEPRGGYVNVLNPKVVQTFIETTHDRYYETFSDEFGPDRSIPGIFTDEPQYAWLVTPWSDDIPQWFRGRRGYDLLASLPLLFYELPGYRKVRHDFYRTVTEMFVQTFTKRIYEWCQAHRISLTGHQNENSGDPAREGGQAGVLWFQVGTGGAMPHYEYMQIPGIDQLKSCIHYDRMERYIIPLGKQVSSVAHQFGGRRVLCEIFGNSGQNMSFDEQKWLANWLFVVGVDLLCPHLALYSLRGNRKRDCPPTLSYHQPWWDYFHIINDRFARIAFMLTQGRHVADILVLHPISSTWCDFHPDDSGPTQAINEHFVALSESLMVMHRGFDYGDELIMQRHAEVHGSEIKVGTCSYSIVIIPPSLSMLRSTFDLIRQFVQQGGVLIALEPLPSLIEGELDPSLESFLRANAQVLPNHREQIKEALDKLSRALIQIFANGGDALTVLCQHRCLGRKQMFFMANTDQHHPVTCDVSVADKGQLQMWDTATGEVLPLPCRSNGDGVATEVELPPGDSCILVLDPENAVLIASSPQEIIVRTVPVDPPWRLQRHDLNALTLDYCDYQFDGGQWMLNQPVLRDLARPPYGDPTGIVTRMLEERSEESRLILRYRFEVESRPPPDSPLCLVMESASTFAVKLNGQPLRDLDLGHWVDPSFERLDITGRLQDGENVIEADTAFGPLTEVENCYIVGEFGVRRIDEGSFAITGEREEVDGRDLVGEGMPFYSGCATLSREVDLPAITDDSARKIYLRMDTLNAIAADVSLNGIACDLIAYRDWRIDVTSAVRSGRNFLSIKLVGSLRNLLGHHHFDGPEVMSTWSMFAAPEKESWTDKYNFAPFGVEGVGFEYVRLEP